MSAWSVLVLAKGVAAVPLGALVLELYAGALSSEVADFATKVAASGVRSAGRGREGCVALPWRDMAAGSHAHWVRTCVSVVEI